MARAMKHQTTLLLGRLGRDERILALVTASQIASASAASFLLPFDVGLHVGRRHQAYGVTKLLKLARPMM